MNIENMRKLRDHLVRNRGRIKMDFFFAEKDECGDWIEVFDLKYFLEIQEERPKCGTAACVAGHAAALFYDYDSNLRLHAEDFARDALDLTYRESQWLFYAGWAVDWQRPLEEVTPDEVLRAVELLIESEEARQDINAEESVGLPT